MSDTDFAELESAEVPPHRHPEYRHFGQQGFAQTLPTFATASVVQTDSVPNLLAVHMYLPAGEECRAVSVATSPQGFAAGSWRAAIYDGTASRLPLGVTTSAPADKNPWWHAPLLQPIPAADQPRPVWVVLEKGQVQGMALLIHKPLHPGLLAGLTFHTLDHVELPAQLSFQGWESSTLVPIVALS
jgi:hypothetical protein